MEQITLTNKGRLLSLKGNIVNSVWINFEIRIKGKLTKDFIGDFVFVMGDTQYIVENGMCISYDSTSILIGKKMNYITLNKEKKSIKI